MALWQVLLLALLQGATEFLPVSSSGHLLLASHLLGVGPLPLRWMVLFHAGTFLAVLWAYRHDGAGLLRALWPGRGRPDDRHLLGLMVGASAVTGVIALGVEPWLAKGGLSLGTAAAGWWTTGLLLLASSARKGGRKRLQDFTLRDALWVGVFQGAALLPGFSRSGLTLAAGLFRGLEPREAVRFSFLLALPAMAAASLWELQGIYGDGGEGFKVMVGLALAFLSGLGAIGWVKSWATAGKLPWLALYNLALGAAVGGWWLLG